MRARAEALGQFDKAAQDQAEAVIKEIEANQRITEDVLSALPYTGDALDLLAAWSGETLSGEKIGGWDRFFRAACVAGPVALEEALKRSPRMQEALGQILTATGEMGADAKNALLKKLGVSIEKFDEMAEATGKFLTKDRHIFNQKAGDVVSNAQSTFRRTKEGLEDLEQMKQMRKASRETVDELEQMVRKGGEAGDEAMEELIIRMQKDKTAQGMMNGPDVPDDVRKKANETIKKIYNDTDIPTKERIRTHEDVRKFAGKHGLDPYEVTVWNPTNKKGAPDVDPDFKKYGRDRDVTYQIKGKTKDGRTVTLDVDHNISSPIYEEELYKRSHGGKLPEDMAEVKKFATETDQMVTSKWKDEAYNTGPDVAIDDWLNNDIMPPVERPGDIRDTMITKSEHWFHQAATAGRDTQKYSKDMAEGMRQATKQWDNIIMKRAKTYGSAIPPRLEKSIEIFKQVEKGQVSPKQAEHMLAELGKFAGGAPLTPKRAVEDMGHFFEAMEKGQGTAFRTIKTKELSKALNSVNDMSQKTDMIRKAYEGGQISGETFRKMREGTFTLPDHATKKQIEALKQWAGSAWTRRALSETERRYIEEQVGPLDKN